MAKYKILALDGGANWTLLQCMALDQLYHNLPGLEILARFDMVAANSGGTMVVAGLLKNQTPAEILATYDHPGSTASLLVELPLLKRLPSLVGVGPRFSTEKKRERIRASLRKLRDPTDAAKDIALRDVGTLFNADGLRAPKIFFASFDYDHERAVFLRSFDSKGGQRAAEMSLVDAVHASTTAPVILFDKPAEIGERRYWDGAIGGYNNPVMAAVVEAMVDGAAPGNIAALSLGAGGSARVPLDHPVRKGPKDFFEKRGRLCLLQDIRKMSSSIVGDPPEAAGYTAHVTLGKTVVRMNPSIQPVLINGEWTKPAGLTTYALKELMALPPALFSDDAVRAVKALGASWIAGDVPNQPLRRGPDLDCAIGDATFAAAAQRWVEYSSTP